MRLAVDVMGGDHGPEELLQGVKLALAAEPGVVELYVVGPKPDLEAACSRIGLTDPRLKIHHASEVLSMEDDPGLAVRRKKDSSLLRAIELVREGAADAVISSGNTGGLLAGATIRLGRLKGVRRPALACILPTLKGAWVLIDGGANPEGNPEMLLQFAIMGSAYSRAMLGVESPRVGVLSNGSEDAKGNELTRATVALIRKTDLNCAGYCEGYDLFLDGVDVAVCDGFVGNIVLKSAESLGKAVRAMLKEELTSHWIRMLGAKLAEGGLRRIAARMNPEVYGGALLLGLDGCAVKIHGGAKRDTLRHAISQTRRFVELQLNDAIVRDIARYSAIEPAAPAGPN
jgi:glycerol-3-phosphate acyltransferase PlsX